MKRHLLLALTLALALTAQGCALVNKDNRVLLNSLDEATASSGISENKAARIAVAPIFVPAGLVAATADVVVVTPIRAVGPALADTSELLWENPSGSEFRQMALFLPKVTLTPLLFGTDWTFRSIYGFTESRKGGKASCDQK